MMKVVVVIVSFNFKPWIDRCLMSLRNSSHPVFPVVVDNCSSDDTVEIIRRDYPEVHLIENESNVGFGIANNQGIAYALDQKASHVFLLNQDAWLEETAIEQLLAAFDAFPDMGLLSPVHLDSTGLNLDKGFAHHVGLSSMAYLECFSKQKPEVIPASFINAAFWMFPAKTLKAIGGFSPLFFYCAEDLDVVNRLRYHGYKLGYLASAYGYHDRENRVSSYDSSPAYHLSEYANINYSFLKAFMMAVPAQIKKVLICLKDRNFSKSMFFLKHSWNVFGKTTAVIRQRKRVKTKAPHFITS